MSLSFSSIALILVLFITKTIQQPVINQPSVVNQQVLTPFFQQPFNLPFLSRPLVTSASQAASAGAAGQPIGFNAYCTTCFNNLFGIATTQSPPVTTNLPDTLTTKNIFQKAGWETDDKGNVFVGSDDSKLLLISVGSYWPFPKDYRRRRR
ncbi:unnamed protein product [Cylicocyclus nassatus]|uniref:Uncharacterized protein n=1 Tax=Cylicocyclus nassatus TaxID=53992 RepID=A0AA36H8E8_CYLNA|nr:unnamed protein product [Cylicocyclus nassatus]